MSAELSNKRPSDKDIAGVFRCIDRRERFANEFQHHVPYTQPDCSMAPFSLEDW